MSILFVYIEEIRRANTALQAAKDRLDNAYKAFGKEFRKRRKEEGLSLGDCAKNLKLSKAYLSDVELGRRNANEKILKLFN